MSDSLQPHGLQHTKLPSPSPTPRAYSNSCPLSRWYYPIISSSVVPFIPHSIIPSTRVFSDESILSIRWTNYWSFSFSINPSNEYSGLISFRMDWLDLLAVQGTLKNLLRHHSSKASILVIKDMQIKTMMRRSYTPIRISIIKNYDKFWWGYGETGLLLYS